MTGKKRPGFTLIELMITVAILSIIATGLYQLRTQNILANQNHVIRRQAIWAMQSQAAILENKPYDQLPEAGVFPFSGELGQAGIVPRSKSKVQVENAEEGLKKFTLTLEYRDARMVHRKVSLTMYRCSK